MLTEILLQNGFTKVQYVEHSPRILYVDDDPDDTLLFNLMMEEAGVENVDTFVPEKNPQEVVDHLHKSNPHLPDAILVDVKLGAMDGVEVLRAIREQAEFNHIPVFLISGSGYFLETITREHPDLTIDGFLEKPISIERLEDVLQAYSEGITVESLH